MSKSLFLTAFSAVILISGCYSSKSAKKNSDAYSNPTQYASTITNEDLYKHVNILASDEYEGRETGKKGQKMAAAYIADQFKSLGIKGVVGDTGYFQQFELMRKGWGDLKFSIDKKQYKFKKDYYTLPYYTGSANITTNEVFFAGYGISDSMYNDYKNVDLTDKVVFVLNGEPIKNDTSLITSTLSRSSWSTTISRKITAAKDQNVKALFIVTKDIEDKIEQVAPYIDYETYTLKEDFKADKQNDKIVVAFISEEMADQLLEKQSSNTDAYRESINNRGRPKMLKIKSNVNISLQKVSEQVVSENVLGFIEGTDPELKNEIVVVTAHYDHEGIKNGEIYNGADDNASGTAAVLEIAEAFVKAKKNGNGPRRSVLIMPISGEEKGLLGSDYYSRYPVFPLQNTIANLNIDMIGRVDKAHQKNPEYVYVIGSNFLSTELHNINENANATYTKLNLDYKYNSKTDPNQYYTRSDHYNFAKHGIPVIFYFNGTHPDYHQPTDTIEKLNFDVLNKRTRLIFYTAWELANRAERPKVDSIN